MSTESWQQFLLSNTKVGHENGTTICFYCIISCDFDKKKYYVFEELYIIDH